jgi:hypothetical protein
LLTDCQFRLLSFHQGSYFSAHRFSVQTPVLSSRELLLCLQIVSSDSCPFIKAVTSLLTDCQFRLLSFQQGSYFSAHRLSDCPLLADGQFRLLSFHKCSYYFAYRLSVQTHFISSKLLLL